jgi:diaminobutyrate-2-oxoglutarate transaminase
VCRRAFETGLLLETSGPDGEVVKLLPPLTATDEDLDEGLGILARSVRHTA